MTSAIPGAVAYLLGLAAQATQAVPEVVVADGWTDQRAAVMFGVGVAAPPFFDRDAGTDITGQPTLHGIGSTRVQEDFTVPHYIYAGAGGVDSASVRATAFSVWDAFLPLFVADLSLGGALRVGRYAEISRFAVSGPRDPAEAEGGRYCLIQFDVHAQNLI